MSIYEDSQTTSIDLLMQFNVTNTNYFKMSLKEINVDISFHGTVVGESTLNLTSQSVSPLTTKSFKLVGNALFNAANSQTIVAKLCGANIAVHLIFLMFDAKVSMSHWGHAEQVSSTNYQYVDCGKNINYHKG